MVWVGEADATKTIAVTKGQDIVVSLRSSPSAGYSWKVTSNALAFSWESVATRKA